MLRAAMLHRSTKLILSVLLCCALVPACDKKEEAKKDAKAAEPEKTEQDKELEARLAAKKAEREAEAKAAEDKVNAIKALAALPEKLPKDLKTACKGVATAQDEYMKKHYEGEGLQRWNEAKGTQMGLLETGCIKAGNIEIAACQINAMNNAPGEYKNDLPELLKACIDKFGVKEG
jgi:vancomycin resistance protein YoaR